MCLVDLHTVLTDPRSELHQVVKACHRRAEATVDRTEENSKRGRYIKAFRCWAALAWASIGPLFDEMQSRAIILPLRPALPQESRNLDHSSPGRNQTLIDCRRQFAAWAPTITTPLDPVIPEPLYSRIADNWRPLVALAELAGGDWPKRVLVAIEELRQIEHDPSLTTRLFTAIRDVFDIKARADMVAATVEAGQPMPEPEELAAVTAAPDTQITTPDLLRALNNHEESGLNEEHHGRAINVYWLRKHLRKLPIRAADWWVGPKKARKHESGYYRHQFDDTFARYRIHPPAKTPAASGATGATGAEPENPSNPAEFLAPHGVDASGAPSGAPSDASFRTPDESPDESKSSGSCGPAESLAKTPGAPVSPDAPDGEPRTPGGLGAGAIDAAREAQPVRRREKRPANGADPTPPPQQTRQRKPAAKKAAPEPKPLTPIPPYQPGTWGTLLAEEVRRLHRENPQRSITWLSKQTGQPENLVRTILRPNGEAE
jgi:hypothetical protein